MWVNFIFMSLRYVNIQNFLLQCFFQYIGLRKNGAFEDYKSLGYFNYYKIFPNETSQRNDAVIANDLIMS